MDLKKTTEEKLSAHREKLNAILENIRIAELTNNKAEAERLKTTLAEAQKEVDYYSEVDRLVNVPLPPKEVEKPFAEYIPQEQLGNILPKDKPVSEKQPDYIVHLKEEPPIERVNKVLPEEPAQPQPTKNPEIESAKPVTEKTKEKAKHKPKPEKKQPKKMVAEKKKTKKKK